MAGGPTVSGFLARGELERRGDALAGTFNSQDVANTLWAYATMGWAYATIGREPGAGVTRALERWAGGWKASGAAARARGQWS